MAPPSTPAQPRFLPPKSEQQKNASQQFASTPRFSVSKSTPHQTTAPHNALPFSTPAQPSARARATLCEPLSDRIDTSPVSSTLLRDDDRGEIPLKESIEVESPSSSSWNEDGERTSKRRRLTISPLTDPIPGEYESIGPMASEDEAMMIRDTPLSDDDDNDDEALGADELGTGSEEPMRHPTFLSAPRFKASVVAEAESTRRPLPDAFSPQRRGAKYVPGGLAAEVRDWLVQVRGASEYDRPSGHSVRFNVDQVRSCHPGGMCMVSGTEVESEQEGSRVLKRRGGEEGQPTKVILAGEGRIVGLGGRNVVAKGKTLSLHQPMWDIALDGLGSFGVACDWDAGSESMGDG